MIKLIGAVLIAGSCSMIGFSMNAALSRRVAGLKSFLSALQIIQAEVVFQRARVRDILAVVRRECSGPAVPFFDQINRRMEEGASFWSAYLACQPELRKLSLTAGDAEVITSAMRVVGKYDSAAQADVFRTSIGRLNEEIAQAAEDNAKKGKLYRAMGVSVGIMIALIAI